MLGDGWDVGNFARVVELRVADARTVGGGVRLAVPSGHPKRISDPSCETAWAYPGGRDEAYRRRPIGRRSHNTRRPLQPIVKSRLVVRTFGEKRPVTSASLQTRFGSYHPSVDGAETTHVPNSVDVTVILPCYNEEAHVALEIERISASLDASGFSYELLVIDDKSTAIRSPS
jgi:hypothetical protein